MVHKSDYVSTNGTPIINPANIVNGRILNGGIKKVSNNKVVELTKYRLSENDILLARRGDLKKCAIVTNSHVNSLCGTGTFFLHLIFISPHYFRNIYSSNLVQDILKKDCVGATMDNLNQSVLANIFIPIPPLGEQMRINKRLEYYFSLLNLVEDEGNNLHVTIKQAKSKILNLAIHGKLVPQDSTDEPASELLKRINPKAESTCDNPHYRNLPEGWAVTTIKDMCENINGLWKGKKKPFVNVGVIRNANFTKDFKLDYSKIEYIDVEQRAFNQRHLKNGDLIVEKSGGSDNNPVGRAILYEGKDAVFSFSNFTMALRIKEKKILTSRYLYYFLLAEYQKGSMRLMQTQTTGLHNLILDKYLSMPILLPPFPEQLRVTTKIEELFDIMDAIKANL